MSSHTYGVFMEIEPTSSALREQEPVHNIPTAPQKAKARTYHSVPHSRAPSPDIELETIQWNTLDAQTPSGTQTPSNETQFFRDVERSGSASPSNEPEVGNRSVEAIQSWSHPHMNRYRLLSVCLMNFGNGLSDSAPGALLPYIEKDFNIGYAIVSLVFVSNAVGFITSAFFVDMLRSKLGRGRLLILAQTLMLCGYIPIICSGGHSWAFPIVVVSFLFLGLGMAINLALSNVFTANLQNGTQMLGFLHGSYGIGGTIGPLVATSIVSSTRHTVWSLYYILVLSVTFTNMLMAGWSFWHYEAESPPHLLTDLQRTSSRTQNEESAPSTRTMELVQIKQMLATLKTRTVLLGALFIFAYQGAEVSISGWVISFLITTRDGNPSKVGFVTSGFWGGITLGRFLLSQLAPSFPFGKEKGFVYFVVTLAAIFQGLVWAIPNVVGDAVAVSIVGFVLGPVYPSAVTVFSRVIPRRDQVSSLSVISAFGSSGGALMPLCVGILAQVVGTYVLHPVAIGLFGVMVVCWYFLGDGEEKKSD